jgi:hypothetical protein
MVQPAGSVVPAPAAGTTGFGVRSLISGGAATVVPAFAVTIFAGKVPVIPVMVKRPENVVIVPPAAAVDWIPKKLWIC